MGHPSWIAWPGGLPCPWTRGTVDAVACQQSTGQATEPTKSAMHDLRPSAGSGTGLVGGAAAAGVGHASIVRPDPSTLGVVGERGSRHEGRLWDRLSRPNRSALRVSYWSQEVICWQATLSGGSIDTLCLVGATGFEPVTSSVSGIWGAARRPAADGRVCSMSWAAVCPVVTGVVHCDPVVRGPDVAPVWPRRSRAWKARPVPSSWPNPAPLPQVRASADRPLLSVSDRQMPMLRARGGHGRRESTAPLQRGGNGTS
jgi:hypothetical protein